MNSPLPFLPPVTRYTCNNKPCCPLVFEMKEFDVPSRHDAAVVGHLRCQQESRRLERRALLLLR